MLGVDANQRISAVIAADLLSCQTCGLQVNEGGGSQQPTARVTRLTVVCARVVENKQRRVEQRRIRLAVGFSGGRGLRSRRLKLRPHALRQSEGNTDRIDSANLWNR